MNRPTWAAALYYMGKKIRTHLLREREQALHTDEKGIQEDGPGCIPRRSGHGVMVDLQEPQKAVVKNQSGVFMSQLLGLRQALQARGYLGLVKSTDVMGTAESHNKPSRTPAGCWDP